MVEVLYCLEYRFMRKTFASIHRHVDASAAYLPLRPAVVDAWPALEQVRPTSFSTDGTAEPLDDAVRAVDPDVIVANSRFRPDAITFPREYPFVHVRHGCSVGRDEVDNTTADLDGSVDVALAPGEYWAQRYREGFSSDVETPVVGIPEADDLVGTEPPGNRRILYAPTNHNYGGGSYLDTAEAVLDAVAGSRFELRFRPHPHDRTEEPGRSLTERCKQRIGRLPNVTFDETPTPKESMLDADLLLSDYSGIVTEWLHTGRPLVQLTTIAAERTVPQLGYRTDHVSLDLLESVYDAGYPADVSRAVADSQVDLGIPMDGQASVRAAQEVLACTQ